MKLALGTVQFGLAYGVANRHGQPGEEEVRLILDHASRAGLRVIDTASLYGTSEEVLGRCLPEGHRFDIVTKTGKFAGVEPKSAARQIRETFLVSLERLGEKSLYGLMTHDSDDLLGPSGEAIWAEMQALKAEGLVEKIGGSVYTSEQIDALLARYPLDLVQLPLSIVDQRLIASGALARLSKANVEVHARSAFLQGAILMPPDALPAGLAALKPQIAALSDLATQLGTDVKTLALHYVASRPEIAAVVCGVDTPAQFDELAAVMQLSLPEIPQALSKACACDDPHLVNPALWRKS